jgi:hypothetical protein
MGRRHIFPASFAGRTGFGHSGTLRFAGRIHRGTLAKAGPAVGAASSAVPGRATDR